MNVAVSVGANNVASEPEHTPVPAVDTDWQVIADNPVFDDGDACVSVTDTSVNGTSPVLVATKVYVTVSPTDDTDFTLADFTTDNAGVWVAGTTTSSGGDVTGDGVGPPGEAGGGVPDATAESANWPLVKSAWVTT